MKHAPRNLPAGVEIVNLNLVIPNIYTNLRHRKFVIEKLIKENNLKSGAELGLKDGKTMAHILSRCLSVTMIGVDLWDTQPNNDGPENYMHWNFKTIESTARQIIKPFSNRSTIYKMTTNNASLLVKDNSLDFVFIDADHSEKGVKEDIINWAPKVKSSGYILGHDVAWKSVYNTIINKFKKFEVASDHVWIAKKVDML